MVPNGGSSSVEFNLCSAGNLEPRFGNHGLQILGEGLFQGITREIRNFSKMNSLEERFAICISARQEPGTAIGRGFAKACFFWGGAGGRKKAHKLKLFALVRVRLTLGQPARLGGQILYTPTPPHS